jgi:hypothetical protein
MPFIATQTASLEGCTLNVKPSRPASREALNASIEIINAKV